MTLRRHALAQHLPSFGRRARVTLAAPQVGAPTIGDDAKLFALTFLGGFMFMAVYLA